MFSIRRRAIFQRRSDLQDIECIEISRWEVFMSSKRGSYDVLIQFEVLRNTGYNKFKWVFILSTGVPFLGQTHIWTICFFLANEHKGTIDFLCPYDQERIKKQIGPIYLSLTVTLHDRDISSIIGIILWDR